VEFDGVYENSDVWINGERLGRRPFGYIPFAYDLTPHLVFGKENVLALRVDNSRQPNCHWYSGSGIYRHVSLLASDPVHVNYWGTYVTTLRTGKEAALVQVKTQVVNDTTAAVACILRSEIVDASGAVIAVAEARPQ
jgi:beta-galactosidase